MTSFDEMAVRTKKVTLHKSSIDSWNLSRHNLHVHNTSSSPRNSNGIMPPLTYEIPSFYFRDGDASKWVQRTSEAKAMVDEAQRNNEHWVRPPLLSNPVPKCQIDRISWERNIQQPAPSLQYKYRSYRKQRDASLSFASQVPPIPLNKSRAYRNGRPTAWQKLAKKLGNKRMVELRPISVEQHVSYNGDGCSKQHWVPLQYDKQVVDPAVEEASATLGNESCHVSHLLLSRPNSVLDVKSAKVTEELSYDEPTTTVGATDIAATVQTTDSKPEYSTTRTHCLLQESARQRKVFQRIVQHCNDLDIQFRGNISYR